MANSNGVSRLTRETQELPFPDHAGDGAPPAQRRREPRHGEYGHPESPPDQAPQRNPLTEGTRPRPVTAATARRCELWNEGRLILEDPFGSHELGPIDDNLTAMSQPSDPTIEGRTFSMVPGRTLTFIPSS